VVVTLDIADEAPQTVRNLIASWAQIATSLVASVTVNSVQLHNGDLKIVLTITPSSASTKRDASATVSDLQSFLASNGVTAQAGVAPQASTTSITVTTATTAAVTSGSSLSPGAIAGIVIACCLVAVGLVVAAVLYFKRHKSPSPLENQEDLAPEVDENASL